MTHLLVSYTVGQNLLEKRKASKHKYLSKYREGHILSLLFFKFELRQKDNLEIIFLRPSSTSHNTEYTLHFVCPAGNFAIAKLRIF